MATVEECKRELKKAIEHLDEIALQGWRQRLICFFMRLSRAEY